MLNANSQKQGRRRPSSSTIAISQKAQAEQASDGEAFLYPSNTSVDLSSFAAAYEEDRRSDRELPAIDVHACRSCGEPAVSDPPPYLEVLQSVIIGKMTPEQAGGRDRKGGVADQGPVKP